MGKQSFIRYFVNQQHNFVLENILHGLCFAVFSPINREVFLEPCILPDWKSFFIVEFFAEISIPIPIENDTNADVFAEILLNRDS